MGYVIIKKSEKKDGIFNTFKNLSHHFIKCWLYFLCAISLEHCLKKMIVKGKTITCSFCANIIQSLIKRRGSDLFKQLHVHHHSIALNPVKNKSTNQLFTLRIPSFFYCSLYHSRIQVLDVLQTLPTSTISLSTYHDIQVLLQMTNQNGNSPRQILSGIISTGTLLTP